MEKKISITIEDDIYDRFCLALNLFQEESPGVFVHWDQFFGRIFAVVTSVEYFDFL